jgi:hypothetical protein
MPSTTEKAMMDNEDLPEAAPAFAAHFSNPVYDDPAGEFAPFGSDEGFDMLYEWAERRDELVRFVDEADVRWGSLGHSLPAGGRPLPVAATSPCRDQSAHKHVRLTHSSVRLHQEPDAAVSSVVVYLSHW